MPRNKKEGIIFGVTMCFLMVCGMSAYNLALVGKLSYTKFAIGLIPGFIVAFFFDTVIVWPVAKKLAFKLPIDRNNKLQTILAISLLMITGMVTFMSVFGLLMRPELPENIIQAYFTAWGMNFIAALPLQLLLVGPISRLKLQMWQRYFDNRA